MVENVQHPASTNTAFLDQPPSCLEFCPEIPDHFVVGTYLLSETKNEAGDIQQAKTGSVQLWKLNPATSELSLVQKVALPYAVFDLHFHPRNKSKFAIAGSKGCVALFNVSGNTATHPALNQVWTKHVHEDPSIPALFLAWAPQEWFPQERADGFAVTFSDSRTTVFGTEVSLEDENNFSEWGSFAARQMIEVWFVALAAMERPPVPENKPKKTPFLFTGNDFGSLHTRRFQVCGEEDGGDDDETEPLAPLLLEHDDRARHHTAGVTAILPFPIPLVNGAPVLLTGSYDEGLRVYHATRRGEVLAEQGLGGGVWRLQILESTEVYDDQEPRSVLERCFLVLASCMHAGTRIVRVTQNLRNGDSDWAIEVLAEFTEHESMNYASDVWKGPKTKSPGGSELLFVSSSFYDRRVCVWKANV